MKKLTIASLVSVLFLFSGCGWLENRINQLSLTVASGDYKISLYSGGKMVRSWKLHDALIQTEKSSDGYYFSYKGKLVRVSGDIVVEEI